MAREDYIREGEWWHDQDYLESAEITTIEQSLFADYLDNYIDREDIKDLLDYYEVNEADFWEDFRDSYYSS